MVPKLPDGALQDVIAGDGNRRCVANAVVASQVTPEQFELHWKAVGEGNDIHLYGTRWYHLRADPDVESLDTFRGRCKCERNERKVAHYWPFTSGHLRSRDDSHALVAHRGVDGATAAGA